MLTFANSRGLGVSRMPTCAIFDLPYKTLKNSQVFKITLLLSKELLHKNLRENINSTYMKVEGRGRFADVLIREGSNIGNNMPTFFMDGPK